MSALICSDCEDLGAPIAFRDLPIISNVPPRLPPVGGASGPAPSPPGSSAGPRPLTAQQASPKPPDSRCVHLTGDSVVLLDSSESGLRPLALSPVLFFTQAQER